VKLNLSLTPKVEGMKLTVRFRWTGSELTPINTFTGKTLETSGGLSENSYNWGYDYGDGRYDSPSGKNGGGLSCEGASKRVSGTWTSQTPTHTYLEPGTYTFSFRVTYCGPNGEVPIEKTLKIKIAGPTPTSSPSP
jgi:hypothetical protein